MGPLPETANEDMDRARTCTGVAIAHYPHEGSVAIDRNVATKSIASRAIRRGQPRFPLPFPFRRMNT